MNEIIDLLNHFCQTKTFTTKKNRSPYVTNDLIQVSKNRDKLFRKAHKTKNNNDRENAVKARSEANIAITKARRHYIINEIKSAKGNHLKFWDSMKKQIPSPSCNTINSVFADDETTLLTGKMLLIGLIPIFAILVPNSMLNFLQVLVQLNLFTIMNHQKLQIAVK